ncbi:trimeric intracellular cation channel family protein [Salibacter sp.]|uniref:trimeric intracellular cation channel family protein n=1 Tax=Salibacter sp. TaxID=2010995 RepID=UPI0028708980|nr:trimeric intracellular cation channel family protein [Salibacter sp.]MDR9399623.1 trimeric intracellular cation channel family protein [Salibacter sp.]MDR9486644.1 trimeric intracellular cation channel family protein [Salibacter sp.]
MELSWFNIIEILGTIAFASSGTTRAIRKQYDLFGLFVLGFVTAIGGGTIRDIFIGNLPVEWLSDFTLTITIIITVILTYLFYRFMDKLKWWVFFFDAIGLGLFTVLGIEKALDFGLNPLICLLIGVITACFGGVIRDILSSEKPLLLREEIYAFASISGGIMYLILDQLTSINNEVNTIISVITIVMVRTLSIRYKWSLKVPFKTQPPE